MKWSKLLSVIEELVYVCPTLGTVLYYYFSSIREEVSLTSQYTFILALCLFVFFLVFKGVSKKKIAELRQACVQTETDLTNTPNSDVEKREKLATNALKMRRKLDMVDRGSVLLSLLVFALAVHILEQALIGLTSLALIACASVCGGFGIHLGVLALRKKEAVK